MNAALPYLPREGGQVDPQGSLLPGRAGDWLRPGEKQFRLSCKKVLLLSQTVGKARVL